MAALVPSWLKWYKKPSYVDLKVFASSLNRKAEGRDPGAGPGSARNSVLSTKSDLSIPQNLTLERILNNRTCSPMSLYDFYMYLKHIEFSQENLEFYTWFRDYEKRWNQEALKARKSTSQSTIGTPKQERPLPHTDLKRGPVINEKELSVLDESEILPEFMTFIESLVLYKAARYPRPCCTAFSAASDTTTITQGEENPLAQCVPSSIQEQHHQELQQIIAMFLTPGGPKELNIPPSMRKAAMAGIVQSESPENFSKIAEHVYSLLKNCSHRNFVRLGINNGTFETLCMVTFVGILFTILGFLTMFLLAFASPHIHGSSRWRGLATIPFWFIGIVFLLAGMRGSCFLLLLFSRRQELPWERVEDSSSVKTTSSSNSIKRFAKKMMIFERKIRVKDVGLRTLQRKIVLQSIAGAIIGTTILEVFFLCLPIWKESRR